MNNFIPDRNEIVMSEYDTDCHCCGYKAKNLKWYPKGISRRTDSEKHRDHFNLFCEICASTFLSHSVTYPEQCRDTSLYQSIGWIANRLLEAIEKGETNE